MKQQYAIGIFDEGTVLQVVCLSRTDEEIKVVDADFYKLAGRLESVDVGEGSILSQSQILEEVTRSADISLPVCNWHN